ncbi:hypothetical protein [Stieleria varia]|uniref:hypothetical protein n=1 Tax=Stieleria varia TaxID=2528005 RepID=UPI0011B83793|nr:hypothetical protein [Stieleria varia]
MNPLQKWLTIPCTEVRLARFYKWKLNCPYSVTGNVRRMKMQAIPKIELAIDVPADEVASYLRERTPDARIDSIARLLHIDIETEMSLTEQSPRVFASANRETHWFGTTELTCVYTLTSSAGFQTHLEIQVTYAIPWLLRSILGWPFGDMMVDAIKVSVLSTVSELIALEKGTATHAQSTV